MLNLNNMSSFNPSKDDLEELPNKRGLYFICIKNKTKLPLLASARFKKIYGRENILYVGISKKGLRVRDYQNHFRGSARTSTLRKSLGALFGWKEADRVRYEKEKRKKNKYYFKSELEKKLTDWMKNNLILFYFLEENTNVLNDLEKYYIGEISSPINILNNMHALSLNAVFIKKLKKLRTNYSI